MSLKFKYLIVKERGEERPVIFSTFLDHSSQTGGRQVISGGFVNIHLGDPTGKQIECWGESVSCKVKTRRDIDEKIIIDDGLFRM